MFNYFKFLNLCVYKQNTINKEEMKKKFIFKRLSISCDIINDFENKNIPQYIILLTCKKKKDEKISKSTLSNSSKIACTWEWYFIPILVKSLKIWLRNSNVVSKVNEKKNFDIVKETIVKWKHSLWNKSVNLLFFKNFTWKQKKTFLRFQNNLENKKKKKSFQPFYFVKKLETI